MDESSASSATGNDEKSGTDHVAASVGFQARANLPFPVVGIGASAGGIAALGKFLEAMPADSGMACVVVQHLPPEHESHMPAILSRHTAMPVQAVEDGMVVQPNHVYVIRPGSTMTLSGGRLHLGEPVEKHGHRRPVDDFFRSLADEQKEKAIGIVLSGTGANGTAGAQAIKAAGGMCIAQDPETAEFSGMPSSLIRAGYADEVLSPSDMPPLLLKYIHHPYVQSGPGQVAEDLNALDSQRLHLNEILALLRARTGHQFSEYKKPTLLRRIQRRMGWAGLTDLKEYADFVRHKPDEAGALANDLMINVTGFFRDPDAWEALRDAVIAPLVADQPADQPIRAWVTACASGEEAYTMAMVLMEEAERQGKRIEGKIFATDTADHSLELARAGIYPGGIEGDIAPERLERFFDRDEHTYRIKKSIREMVVFAPQDVLRDPPFSRLDICACRNLLIYLEPEAQRKVLALLHFALREGGFLFLGNAETLGSTDYLFETLSKKWRIYRRAGSNQHRLDNLPALAHSTLSRLKSMEAQYQPTVAGATPLTVQRALMERFIPPSVVVDEQDRILYIHGDMGDFLLHPAGEPTRNLYDHVRIGLRPAVRAAMRQAAAENREAVVAEGFADGPAGPAPVQVMAAPLLQRGGAAYFILSFAIQDGQAGQSFQAMQDLAPAPVQGIRNVLAPAVADGLENELELLQRELQATVEAFEANNEELKAANEEVTSINEELQSSNEELETSKEELQSLNEELITVNNQLQVKISEVEATGNDLANLLSSTNIAVIFLDTNFLVRRFTPAISDLLELIPTDVGRPVAHLAQKFDDSALLDDARAVLDRLVPVEREVDSHSGRWYLRRTLPYRTGDNRIDGVVITFIDISDRKRAEQALIATQARLQAVIEQLPTAALMVEAGSGRLILGNHRTATLFGHPFPLPFLQSEWQSVYTAFRGFHDNGQPYGAGDWPLARSLATGEAVSDAEIGFLTPGGERGTLSVSSSPIFGADGQALAVVSTFTDITARKRAEQRLRESEERFRLLVDNAHDYAIVLLDAGGKITSWNNGAQRLTGWRPDEIIGRPFAELFTSEDRAQGQVHRELNEALEQGKAVEERWHLRKNGERFWGSGVLNTVRDQGGTVRGFVKIMRDATAAKRAEDQLHLTLQRAESLQQSAEQANRSKDEFIALVSHELRTPLNTISLWAGMLLAKKELGKDVAAGLETIRNSARSQAQLIDDLLDVSRMGSGKMQLDVRDTDMATLIGNVVDAAGPMADGRKVVLQARIDPGLGVVRADPDRLQQVLWNLLSNAIKFTPAGGKVSVEAQRQEDTLRIVVKDTGIGIRPEFLSKIFQRFTQEEPASTRQHGGLGLGLSIAKQLVDLHGGHIEASSAGEGKGSTFTVTLPIMPADGHAAAQAGKRAGNAADLDGLEILLVEDDSSTSGAMRRLLEAAGARVRVVDSAQAARQAYEQKQPNLLLSDIGMPGEDGYALLQSIRALEATAGMRRVPAVAITAFASQADRTRAFDAGFDDHLAKPLDEGLLLVLLAGLAGRAPGRMDNN